MTPTHRRATVLAVHVSRIGLTPLKGARHVTRDEVELTATGAVGDRVFCLVDPVRERVLRTVEHPGLPGVRATYGGPGAGAALSLALPDGQEIADRPTDSGEELKADYWGRTVALRLQSTTLTDALSEVVGAPVRLARAEPGEVVYGGAVTIVTTSALKSLAARTGGPVAATRDARFRSTFTVDDEGADLDAVAPGTRVVVGAAELEVIGRVPRCAVVDLDPVLGGRRDGHGPRVLSALPVVDGEPTMGLDARVVRPGVVVTGDPVATLPVGFEEVR